MAITQWMLGIRPTYDGLTIAPRIPDSWLGFKVKRTYRGVQYQINVKRKGPGNDLRLEVDGFEIPGATIPQPYDDRKVVQVTAWLGK